MAAKHDFLDLNPDLHTSIYSYISHLRHHGFPTPILDWTQSPYIASYFAFAPRKNVAEVSIYVLIESSCIGGWVGEARLTSLGPFVRTHKRHYAQQCEYTMSMIYKDDEWWMTPHETTVQMGDMLEFEDQDFYENFVIYKFDLPASERKAVLKYLDEHNINAFTLFGSEESLMETLAIKQFELNG